VPAVLCNYLVITRSLNPSRSRVNSLVITRLLFSVQKKTSVVSKDLLFVYLVITK
jgi:hypothetical protein